MSSRSSSQQRSLRESNNGHIISWWESYLKAILAISLFGGQITFTVIVSAIADPASLNRSGPTAFSMETVRLFVAIAWMLFTITLGMAAIVTILISDTNIKQELLERWKNRRRSVLIAHSVLTLLLNGLPLTAFLFLALAAVAYVPVVGLVTLGITGGFTIAAGILWCIMDERGGRLWTGRSS